MDNQNQQTSQPVMPAPPLTGAQAPQPTQPSTKLLKTEVKVLAGIIVALLILLGIMGYVSKNNTGSPKNPQLAMPSSTPIAQAVIRDTDPIATTSAFLDILTSYASYSAAINAFVPDDPIVAPPFIDLTLDFQ